MHCDNPTEGAWSNMNGLGNLSTANVDQLTAIIKNRLKSIQYRPALIDGFLAQTGLSLEPRTAVDLSLSTSVTPNAVPGPCLIGQCHEYRLGDLSPPKAGALPLGRTWRS
jgi:hypothetical protein